MKKSMLLVATCLFMTCGLFAQNSATEINAEIQTDIEKFINECSYTKTEYVEDFRTKSCYIDALVLTDLETNQKIGGVHIQARDIASAILSMGAVPEKNADLGYLDVSELDDVLKVLYDIIQTSNQEHPLKYVISYTSKSGIQIRFYSDDEEVFIGRTYEATNDFGVKFTYTLTTNDISLKEAGRLIKKLTSAKEKINKVINQ